jgi:hypothetical protein
MSFEELSRRAATGRLSEAEQEALAAHLRAHPELVHERDWDVVMAEKLEQKIAAMPELPGWERTAATLRTEEPSIRPSAILDRLAQWLSQTLGLSFNLQAVAVALVVLQAGVIGIFAWQLQDRPYSDVRGTVEEPIPRGALLRVSFRKDVRESDMRKALAEINGEIVAGPGQLGIYLVRIKDGKLATAAGRLKALGITELVETVERKR